jgi:hypothetical protein
MPVQGFRIQFTSRGLLCHAAKIAALPKTDFLEIAAACEPLCAFLYFCDLAIQSKFDAKLSNEIFEISVYMASRRETQARYKRLWIALSWFESMRGSQLITGYLQRFINKAKKTA